MIAREKALRLCLPDFVDFVVCQPTADFLCQPSSISKIISCCDCSLAAVRCKVRPIFTLAYGVKMGCGWGKNGTHA